MQRTLTPLFVASIALASTAWAQNPPGQTMFEDRCGTCHGGDGNGGEHAPAITRVVPNLQDAQLTALDSRRSAGPRDAGGQRRVTRSCAADRVRPDAPAARRIPALPQELRDDQRQVTRGPGGQRRIRGRAVAIRRQPDPPAAAHRLGQIPRSHVRDRLAVLQRRRRRQSLHVAAQIDKSNVKRVAPKWIFRFPTRAACKARP